MAILDASSYCGKGMPCFYTGVHILLPHFITERTRALLIRLQALFRRGRGVWGVALLLLSCAVSPVRAASPDITVVLSESGGPYAEFTDALRKNIPDKSIVQFVIGAGNPIPGSGLVIAAGMKAATAVAASKASSVLNVLVPRAGYEQLLRDFPRRAESETYSAIFLDQPEYRQVHLISVVLPDKHHVGLLYSSPPEGLERLRRELKEHGFALHEQRVDQEHLLPEALQSILNDSEVLLALPDASIYNGSTIRNILLATYRRGVPLVGFSSAYVNAGALCAVFSTPAQIAGQAAELIRQFGDSDALPTAHYPYEFEVMVNEQVANSLGLRVESAAALQYKLKSEIGGKP